MIVDTKHTISPPIEVNVRLINYKRDWMDGLHRTCVDKYVYSILHSVGRVSSCKFSQQSHKAHTPKKVNKLKVVVIR